MKKKRDGPARTAGNSPGTAPDETGATEVLEATFTRGTADLIGDFRMLSIRRRVKENNTWTSTSVLLSPEDLPRFVNMAEQILRVILECAEEDSNERRATARAQSATSTRKEDAPCAPAT